MSDEFDGTTYDPTRDGKRLRGQFLRVWQAVADGQWRTLPQIKAHCDRMVGGGADTPQAISARLRDFRKSKFGGHQIDRENIKSGLWRYRLVPRTKTEVDTSTLPGDLYAKCGSPIERQFLAAIRPILPTGLTVEPQALISRCHVDFAITGGERRMAVECDGHDFHERTPEQAASDKSRDRRLQAAGWLVFRFTGSEIHRDPVGCASEALLACTTTPEVAE